MTIINDGFGITVMLPGCAFQAEIGREAIEDTVVYIDDEIDTVTTETDPVARMTFAIMHAVDVSNDLANGDVDHETAVSEIASSFIYGYAIQFGVKEVMGLCGLVGSYANDKVVYKPCSTVEEYDRAAAEMKVASDRMTGKVSDSFWSAGHTIH